MTLEANLIALKDVLMNFSDDIHIEVSVRLHINEDVPAGFVEQSSPVMSDSVSYRQIVFAQDGMVKKEITLIIPE